MARPELTEQQKAELAAMDAASEEFKADLQSVAQMYPDATSAIAKIMSQYRLTAGYKRMCLKVMEYA